MKAVRLLVECPERSTEYHLFRNCGEVTVSVRSLGSALHDTTLFDKLFAAFGSNASLVTDTLLVSCPAEPLTRT